MNIRRRNSRSAGVAAHQAVAAFRDRSQEIAEAVDARWFSIAGRANHLSRRSVGIDGWISAGRGADLCDSGSTSEQRVGHGSSLRFVVGFFLPRYVSATKITKTRQRTCAGDWPMRLDLMVISVEAGLGLNAAMVKVSSELKEVHLDIAKNSNWPTWKFASDVIVTKHCAIWRSEPASTICGVSLPC